MSADHVRVDVTAMPLDPPARFRALTEAAEHGGVETLWVCDSSLHARDVYVYLSLVATSSHRLKFGPNCTHPYTRHPGITANALATLQELSGGRARLALGVGDRPVTELGYASAPVAVVRETVAAIRRLWRGETVEAGGPVVLRGARLSVVGPGSVPLYVAASGPRMLTLGAEVADGVLFLAGAWPGGIAYALKRIREGAAAAGRDPSSLDVVCTVAGSLREDPERARQECVPLAAWFCRSAPVYAELAGVPPTLVAQIRQAWEGGHFDAARRAHALVTDPMVDRLTLAGDAATWVARLEELRACGVARFNVFLLSADRLGMVRALTTAVLPELGRRP